jgi:hypothetical protein
MDTLSVVCLWKGALIMAVETALEGAPNTRAKLPKVVGTEKWKFLPAVLVTVAILILIFQKVGWLPSNKLSNPAVSIGQVSLTTPENFSTRAIVAVSKNATRCNAPGEQNIYACFQSKQGDGTIRVIVFFDHPLHYSGFHVLDPDGHPVKPPFYKLLSTPGVWGTRLYIDVVLDRRLAGKTLQIVPFHS